MKESKMHVERKKGGYIKEFKYTPRNKAKYITLTIDCE